MHRRTNGVGNGRKSRGILRTCFEFGFNAEFAQSVVLAGIPHIPTQNQEKSLGYDVKFAIKKRGGPLRYVALQHKVARFVRGGTGLSKYKSAVGPDYYAFRLDVDQFNLIEAITARAIPGFEFYYCAPLFTSVGRINSFYLANSILANSVWIDVSGAGPLSTHEPHTIVYDPSATKAAVFSASPKSLKPVRPSSRPKAQEAAPITRNPQLLYWQLFETVLDYWPSRSTSRDSTRSIGTELRLPFNPPPRREVSDTIQAIDAISELVTKYYGCSLFVEVGTQEA